MTSYDLTMLEAKTNGEQVALLGDVLTGLRPVHGQHIDLERLSDGEMCNQHYEGPQHPF